MTNRSFTSIAARAATVLSYVLATAGMTYPAVVHLSERVLDRGNDVWVMWWNNWWTRHAFTNDLDVYRTDLLFHPDGVSLAYHGFSWLNTALWLLLEPLVGPIAAHNLTILWVFPVAAVGMACLVRDLTGDRGAAWVAGLVFAFLPYRMAQIHHANVIGTQWIPFFTLFLLRALRHGRRRDVLLATLFLVLTGLIGWNLFAYLFLWTAFLATALLLGKTTTWRRTLVVCGTVGLLAVLILMPLILPMLDMLGQEDALAARYHRDKESDLAGYVFPNQAHPIWGEAVRSLFDGNTHIWLQVSPGYVVLGLLGFVLFRRGLRGRTRMWWIAALIWWLIALGRCARIFDESYRRIPLPYNLVNRWYVFEIIGYPHRSNLLLAVPLAVLVGYALARWLRDAGRRKRVLLLGAVAALFLFESLSTPLRMRAPEPPPFGDLLAREEGDFAVVVAPVDQSRQAKLGMLHQTYHGRPMVSGHVSRRSRTTERLLRSNALLMGMHRREPTDVPASEVDPARRQLVAEGVRFVIVHKEAVPATRHARWRAWLGTDPEYEDEAYAVYRLRR